MKKVVIIQRALKKYRVPFYQKLKEKCDKNNIELILVYGKDDFLPFNDAILDWGIEVKSCSFTVRHKKVYFHPIFKYIIGADLVIVEQATKLLENYFLWLLNALGIKKIAFWGHGKNFQAANNNSLSETIKKYMTIHVHWWFAYNELSAKIVENIGYPGSRITVVNNSIDTLYLKNKAKTFTQEDLDKIKNQHNIKGDNVCLFVGGMYKEKRLPFLIEACLQIKKKVPDFEMIFIGAGKDQHLVEEASEKYSWIHYIGPKFGNEIIPYFLISKLLLIPGGVGLAILDSFSLLTPLVTTKNSYHGPEISYLVYGKNGVMVNSITDANVYANNVIELLKDTNMRQRLIEGCRISREQYSIEKMVNHFFTGLIKALF